MPIQKITIYDFINMPTGSFLLLDVRSPSEFIHAHIPFANNLSLFNDEERKVVGTAYKQQSREQAIKIGLKYFGTKMTEMVEQVEQLIINNKLQQPNNKNISIVVHCWRGGMRSAGVAWLLDLYGYKVFTIIGGYKAYRNWVLNQFEKTYHFKVIGGYTGSGKTEVLAALKQQNATIIDLEKLALHKGSAFGNLNEIAQPSQEMFENKLAVELYLYKNEIIWIEDESQRIGNVNIPTKIHQQKQQANVYFLDIPFEERLQYIIAGYGKFGKDKLVNAIIRIKKRLGGLDAKNAINYLLEDDIENCFSILLKYYDKYYLSGLYTKPTIETILTKIPCSKVDAKGNAQTLLSIN
ncbi:MAG: tRNA 2-selenouridine(34) synthase MnmH [Chitinophagaceae bacterium]